jgi:hypothetical protein
MDTSVPVVFVSGMPISSIGGGGPFILFSSLAYRECELALIYKPTDHPAGGARAHIYPWKIDLPDASFSFAGFLVDIPWKLRWE